MIFVTVEKKDLKQTICTKILLRDEKALLILQCTDIERKGKYFTVRFRGQNPVFALFLLLFCPLFCLFYFL